MLKHYEEDEYREYKLIFSKNIIREEAKEGREAVKEMFRVAKERDLEKDEENKTKEMNKVLSDFTKPESKPTSNLVSLPPEDAKPKAFGSKITIKAKKVKTEDESLNNGKSNLVTTNKEVKKPALNLCSYSDDEDN